LQLTGVNALGVSLATQNRGCVPAWDSRAHVKARPLGRAGTFPHPNVALLDKREKSVVASSSTVPFGAPPVRFIEPSEVRAIVRQARDDAKNLIAAGVNSARLQENLSSIERHLDQKIISQDTLRSLLTELQIILIEAANSLVASGILQMLHLILGTGVPVP
jgi:hypothetical protein